MPCVMCRQDAVLYMALLGSAGHMLGKGCQDRAPGAAGRSACGLPPHACSLGEHPGCACLLLPQVRSCEEVC